MFVLSFPVHPFLPGIPFKELEKGVDNHCPKQCRSPYVQQGLRAQGKRLVNGVCTHTKFFFGLQKKNCGLQVP